MSFLCKGVIMKICLYKMDVQSKLLPSTRTRLTATDVMTYCAFVNKNVWCWWHTVYCNCR